MDEGLDAGNFAFADTDHRGRADDAARGVALADRRQAVAFARDGSIRIAAALRRLHMLRTGSKMRLPIQRRENRAPHQGGTAEPRQNGSTQPAHRNAPTIDVHLQGAVHR